jgi:uncharacterized protein (TIGR03083 family)
MTSDQERLAKYVDIWKSSIDDVVALLRSLDEDDWSTPTDLPGWDVRGVAAHLAHLESELSGVEQAKFDVPELEHLTAPSALYTEAGVIARESLEPKQIIDELQEAVEVRLAQLRDEPPTDGSAHPLITPGGMPWSWETMLRNRPLDVWMHEQDIRRAVGRPGGLDSAGAAHTVMVLTMSFPYSVGKRVAPPVGTTVVLDVSGVRPVHLAVEINLEGRAVPMTEEPATPTVRLGMDTETFVILGGGRRTPDRVTVDIEGDQELGRQIVGALAVTP